MTLEHILEMENEKGRAEGRVEGETAMQDKMNKLFKILNQMNRLDDYILSTEDKAFQAKLFEEFDL